jgi:hypothetical protein
MTQAFNLSQLANNLNTSGQLDATDGLVNAVPIANGGTGASTAAAARTNLDVLQDVSPSTSGNVLTSNGSSWLSSAPVVTLAGAETLTNKTLTAPIIVQSINTQTTAAYVTVASDAGAIITVNNASANTFRLPTNASVPYAIGSTITLIQIGAGDTTISAVTPGTTTVLSTGAIPASPVLAQYKSATCIKTATDAWYIVGALA